MRIRAALRALLRSLTSRSAGGTIPTYRLDPDSIPVRISPGYVPEAARRTLGDTADAMNRMD